MRVFVDGAELRPGETVLADDDGVLLVRESDDSDEDFQQMNLHVEDLLSRRPERLGRDERGRLVAFVGDQEIRSNLTAADRLLAKLGRTNTFTFLERLFPANDGYLYLAAASPKGVKRHFVALPNLDRDAVRRFADEHQDANLYFGAASRRTTESGRRENCRYLGTLYADIDFLSERHKDGIEPAEAWRRLWSFGLSPSAIVETGGGLQPYWFLREPVDLDDTEAAWTVVRILKAIASVLGADSKVAELARILRLPGTWNLGYTPKRLAELNNFSFGNRYDLGDFTSLLSIDVEAEEVPGNDAAAIIEHDIDLNERIERARTYLDKMPGAVAGEHGDDHTFKTCCTIARGFNLPEDDAFELLKVWNERCEPPWGTDDDEKCLDADRLRTKLRNAISYGKAPHGSMLVDIEPVIEVPIEDTPVAEPAYTFEPAFPPDHFVSQFVAYASNLTDAAHEYHEAVALTLLATATSDLRIRLKQFPKGLPTNLYVLLVGDSSRSRKSTAKDHGKDLVERVIATALVPDRITPEAFIERLAQQSPGSALWCIDEFGQLLVELHQRPHLEPLKGVLLTVYGGDNYAYQRVSKGKGKQRAEDLVQIIGPHLSILGWVTPLIFDRLHEKDMTSGLLARFAVVMPANKPARRPFFEFQEQDGTAREHLQEWLLALNRALLAFDDMPKPERQVTFDHDALLLIDQVAARHEEANVSRHPMFERLIPMILKVAVLSAVGRLEARAATDIRVSSADARSAVAVIERWKTYADQFARRIGENEFERKLQKCFDAIKGRESWRRRDVARLVHVDRKTLDAIEETLEDRGLIETGQEKGKSGGGSGWKTRVWKVKKVGG